MSVDVERLLADASAARLSGAARTASDELLIIDPETRQIAVPENFLLGVESDQNVERVRFQCPKIVGDNIDLSKLHIYVNYQNANQEVSSYWCQDVEVEGDNITFSWLVSRAATMYQGETIFIVCAKKSDEEGNLTNEWNTTIPEHGGIVLEGLEPDPRLEQQYPDVIEQILAELDTIKAGGGSGGSGQISEIIGKNEDDDTDYSLSTKVKDGNLIAVLEYDSTEQNPDPEPGNEQLDEVAIKEKTYREIFKDGNVVEWGDFESDILTWFNVWSGTPEISTEACVSKSHSVKAFGNISQQYVIINGIDFTSGHKYYIAMKSRCDRHVKGAIGINFGNYGTIGATSTTDGFETFSKIVSGGFSAEKCWIGSISSADLDGYIDDVMIVDLTALFESDIPTKEELDNAYDAYLSIITSDNEEASINLNASTTIEEFILSKEKHVEYTDKECIDAFMSLVNEKAKYYGMSKSNFTSPSGAGGNTTCAKDLAISGYYACGYRDVLDVWKHKQYNVKVYGENAREIGISSTVMNTAIGDYTVYGGKTGSWSGTENLLIIADVTGETFACVVMDCGSLSNRFVAMKELLDVISASSGEVSTATAACAYKLPTQLPQLHDVTTETPAYVKNESQEIIPASVTKVMTAMTAIDYADDLSEKIVFKSSDLESGSGAIFKTGDIISLRDALHAMLLPSSNMCAKAIARNIGKKYLEKFGK